MTFTKEDMEARDREEAVTRMSDELVLPPITESPSKEHKRESSFKTNVGAVQIKFMK